MSTNVVIETDLGDIEVELADDKAPKSVANFLQYVESGHYAGTVFHRVIPGFMAQGGGYDGNMEKKSVKEHLFSGVGSGSARTRRGIQARRRSRTTT